MADEIRDEELETSEVEEKDEQLEAEQEGDFTKDEDAHEEAENLEGEIEANSELVDDMVKVEPEEGELEITIYLDEATAGEENADVVDEVNETTTEEDTEDLIASGESALRAFYEEECDDLQQEEDLTESEAKEELGIVDTGSVEETPVIDSLVNETFVSAPGPGDENNIVVEKFDDNKTVHYDDGDEFPNAATYGEDDMASDNDDAFNDGGFDGESSSDGIGESWRDWL